MQPDQLPEKPAAPFAQQPGPQALHRLLSACFEHHGGSTIPIAQFLMSLYNAEYVMLDTVLLCRRISDQHFEDVITIMRWYRSVAGRLDAWWLIYGPEGTHLPAALAHRFSCAIRPEHRNLFGMGD
jgi:hypothetical protein